jgi:hypothetical protein
VSYISLGDLRMSCERINNNLSLVVIGFTVYRDLQGNRNYLWPLSDAMKLR